MKSNTKPNFELAVLNRYFDKVYYTTYKGKDKDTCSAHSLVSDEPVEFACQPEELMTYCFKQEHSYIIKAGPEIKIIKAYNNDALIPPLEFEATLGLTLTGTSSSEEKQGRFTKRLLRHMRPTYQYLNFQRLDTEWRLETSSMNLGTAVNPQFLQGLLFNLYQDEGLLDKDTAYDQEAIIDNCIQGSDKLGKRLKRLFRPYRYYTYNTPQIRIDTSYDVDVHDGNVLIDKYYVESTFNLLDIKYGQSVELTVQGPAYQVKGHAIVTDLDNADIVLLGDQTKNEIKTKDWFVGIEPHKAYCSPVFTDLQTLCNQWHFYKDKVEPWAEEMLNGVIDDFMNGHFPQAIKDTIDADYDDDGIYRDPWALKRAIVNEVPLEFPWLARRAWNFFRSSVEKLEKNNIRIKIPGVIRGYLTCINKSDDPNSPMKGQVDIINGRVHIHEEDTDWLYPLLGGADGDDSVSITFLKDGNVLLTRNPNMLGEYAIVRLGRCDEVIKRKYANQGLPTININKSGLSNLPSESTEERVYALQSYIVDNYAIEKWLITRLPKKLRDNATVVEGPLTNTMQSVHAMVKQASLEVREFISNHISIPDTYYQLLARYNDNPMRPVAIDIRETYNTEIGKLMTRVHKMEEQHASEEDIESYKHKKFNRVHSKVRGYLMKYTYDEQQMIVRSLARMIYVESTNRSSDGILGVPSSSRTTGTADLFIDLLIAEGFSSSASNQNSKHNISEVCTTTLKKKLAIINN